MTLLWGTQRSLTLRVCLYSRYILCNATLYQEMPLWTSNLSLNGWTWTQQRVEARGAYCRPPPLLPLRAVVSTLQLVTDASHTRQNETKMDTAKKRGALWKNINLLMSRCVCWVEIDRWNRYPFIETAALCQMLQNAHYFFCNVVHPGIAVRWTTLQEKVTKVELWSNIGGWSQAVDHRAWSQGLILDRF